MRTLLLTGLLAFLTLAGCVDPSDETTAAAIPDIATYVAAMADAPVPSVDAGDVLADLKHFSSTFSERSSNQPDHLNARDWMADQFLSYGLDVWRQEFVNGIYQVNIVGIKWGVVPDQWVIVGAHYDMTTSDCVFSPIRNTIGGDLVPECLTRAYSEGAYDDGSGTLMTMHLAKAFAETNPYYTILFAAFDGEERGLQGSGALALAIEEQNVSFMDRPIQVRGMLDLDMIGLNWPGVDAPIYFDQNSEALRSHVEATAAELGMPEDAILYQGITLGRSDYAHFFRMGVPTGFFISDFEQWQLPADLPVTVPQGAYPFWHLEDTYETMELMAGSAEDLEAGFQTAIDLSSSIVHMFAMQPDVELDAEEK